MNKKRNNAHSDVKVFALGGLGEVGKNMYVVEQDDEIIIIDSGILFPDMNYGVDYIIPDYTYLKENEDKIVGLFITHGHEDHIGGIPYLLSQVKIPKVYACGLAVGLIKNKFKEFPSVHIELEEYKRNSIYTFKHFEVSFFRTNHSIPDSFGIAIKTQYGYILHTGDFKFDFTPIADHTEYSKITKFSEEGVMLLLSDSTNAGVEKFAPSERIISKNIRSIFSKIKGRVIISTFASNVYRVEQIVEASVACGRKVIVFGRSMEKTINVGKQLQYIKAPEGTFITAKEFPHLPPDKITILSTGSQGEPLAALSRIAEGTHKTIKIIPGDTIVFSSSAIPGNQESINRTINKLYKAGADVIINSPLTDTHSSGHASNRELQLMLCLAKPKYFAPIHGEYAMLVRHIELAEQTGIPRDHCFILDNGKVLNINEKGVKLAPERINAGNIFIDSNNTIVDKDIIKERKLLADDGIIGIILVSDKGQLIKSPEIVTRGFIYFKENQEVMDSIKERAKQAFLKCSKTHKQASEAVLKKYITNEVSNLVFELTERRPVIVPIIMEISKSKDPLSDIINKIKK